MTTTPAGLPAWSRTASIESYGGHAEKRNYMSQGAINARTDVTAEQLCRMAADLSSVVRVIPLARLVVQNNDTGAAHPAVLGAWLQSGVSSEGYDGDDPPAGFPSVTRVSDGSLYVTFPTALTDDFGVSQNVHIRAGLGAVSGDLADVSWIESDPNSDGNNERIAFTMQDDSGVVIDTLVTLEIF